MERDRGYRQCVDPLSRSAYSLTVAGESKFEMRPWSIAAGLVGSVMLTVYLVLLSNEGNNSFFEILPWVFVVAIATLGAFASAFVRQRHIAGIWRSLRPSFLGASGCWDWLRLDLASL